MKVAHSLLALPAALLLVAGCASTGSTSSPAPSSSVAGPEATASALVVTPSPSPTPVPYGNLILYHTEAGPAGPNIYDFYLIGADGTGKRTLATGVAAHWTADGSAVELVSWDSECVPSLKIYPIDGGAPTAVAIDFKAGDDRFDWTPDGTRLSFFRYTSGTMVPPCGSHVSAGGSAAAQQRDIYVVNCDGSGLDKIASRLPTVEPVAWIPDGSSIVVIRRNWSDAKGPIVRIDVATHAQTTVMASGEYRSVSVSPDGTLMSFTKFDLPHTVWRLHVAAIDGTGNRDLGSATTWDRQLIWGSDNAHAALLREVAAADHTLSGHLYWGDPTVSPVSFAHVASDAETIDINAAWSPGNEMLAYVGVVHSGGGVHPGPVTLIRPDGTGKTALAGTDNVAWVAWQPNPRL